ncbi:MAG: IS110 family transposase [Candidatus Melainabacteria bacterium]|nr:IS110 family transposase [Candidatus Melainabacteria bacterium]
MFNYFVGIDISKQYFDASVEVRGKTRHHKFSNSEKGFDSLFDWCNKLEISNAHFCMEATGAFWIELATWLNKKELSVSVINPACIKRFAQSELKRNKTDKVDAGIISRFCKVMMPPLWVPPTPEVGRLQKLVRRRHDLGKMRQQERNRRSSLSLDEDTLASVERSLKFIDSELLRVDRKIDQLFKKFASLKEKRDLLLSIPGVGEMTANVVLSEVINIDMFDSPKQLAAFAGLAPREISSGNSIRGRTRISKLGNSRLRTILYLPSVTARSCNPVIKEFCNRLLQNGKSPMKVVGAAMRKLLHIIYGVLKSGKPFSVCTN